MRLLVSFAVACLSTLPSWAGLVHVSPTGNDETGDGSIGNPYATPAKGVAMAQDGDEVVLARGCHESTTRVAWTKNIVVRGETSNARDTVIDFKGETSPEGAMAFTSGSVRDLTVSNACTTGVWLKSNPDVFASNIVVTCCDNQAGSANAAGVQLASGTLRDSVVTRCLHKLAGAGVRMGAGTRVIGCTITENEAGQDNAAGIYAFAEDTRVENTTVARNLARYAAGIDGVGVIDTCRILCNTTGVSRYHGQYTSTAGTLGTAVLSRQFGTLLITNSVISGNVTMGTSSGNAVWNYKGQTEIVDTDISETVGRMWGGALYNNASGGGEHPEPTITVRGGTMSGNHNVRGAAPVFLIEHGSMSFTGTVFSDNYALAFDGAPGGDSWDGAVGRVNAGTSLVCTNCTFVGNASADRGGVLYNNGYASFVGCTFEGNRATKGGVVIVLSGTPETAFEKCTFRDNAATADGGVYCAFIPSNDNELPVRLTATDCRFAGNTAGDMGGVIRVRSKSADTAIVLRNCLFDGNGCVTGQDGTGGGGVFYAVVAKAEVSNCTFVNNWTKGRFGGVFYSKWSTADVRVTNCAFVNNLINQGSANESLASTPGFEATADFRNCLLWPAESNTFLTEAKNCVSADPKMTADYQPRTSASPLVNAGVNASWMTGATDVRGETRHPRIGDGTVDIGCYEFYPILGLILLFH